MTLHETHTNPEQKQGPWKQLQTIATVQDQVSVLAGKIERLTRQFEQNLGRTAVAIWRHKANLATSSTEDQEAVTEAIRRVKRTSYDAGCISLELERKLFALDGVFSDEFPDEVRTARRAQVTNVRDAMKLSDDLMNKTKIYKDKFYLGDVAATFLAAVAADDEPVKAAADVQVVKDETAASVASEWSTDTQLESAECPVSEYVDQIVDQIEETAESAPTTQTTQATAKVTTQITAAEQTRTAAEQTQSETAKDQETADEPAASAGRVTDAWKLGETTRWRPQFHQRRTADGIALVADMGGVEKNSLSVTKGEGSASSITVRGVKPLQRLHRAYPRHMQSHMQPHGWFEESFEIPKGYSMAVTSHLDRQYLIINIPEIPPQRAQTARPASSGFFNQYPSRSTRAYSPEHRGFPPFGSSLFGF